MARYYDQSTRRRPSPAPRRYAEPEMEPQPRSSWLSSAITYGLLIVLMVAMSPYAWNAIVAWKQALSPGGALAPTTQAGPAAPAAAPAAPAWSPPAEQPAIAAEAAPAAPAAPVVPAAAPPAEQAAPLAAPTLPTAEVRVAAVPDHPVVVPAAAPLRFAPGSGAAAAEIAPTVATTAPMVAGKDFDYNADGTCVELMRGGQRWRYCQIRPMTVGEMSSMADLLRTGRVVGEVVK